MRRRVASTAALEFLPSDEELAERRVQGKALTRPELSVLISYSKAVLKEQLIDSDLGDDPYLAQAVESAFPQRLVLEYGEEILGTGCTGRSWPPRLPTILSIAWV